MTAPTSQSHATPTSGSLFPPPHLKAGESDLPDANDEQREGEPERKEPLGLLEAPKPSDEEQGGVQKLDVNGSNGNGSSIRFDAIGPVVVNSDGTLSRIHNWGNMTELERERTIRVLGKRNQLRMDDLKKQ